MRGPAWFKAKAGKRDAAHGPIRDGLELLGFIVADLGGAADGNADLAARWPGWAPGRWEWLEVKSLRGALTSAQVDLHARWLAKGVRILVVHSLPEAVESMKRAVHGAPPTSDPTTSDLRRSRTHRDRAGAPSEPLAQRLRRLATSAVVPSRGGK